MIDEWQEDQAALRAEHIDLNLKRVYAEPVAPRADMPVELRRLLILIESKARKPRR